MSRRRGFEAVLAAVALTAVVSGTPAVAAGSTATAPRPDDGGHDRRSGTVWVVNRERGEVSVFDADSGQRLAVRPTGAGAHEVAIAGRQAYVTNEAAGTVSVISTRTLEGETITLGPSPHHAEASRDGETILVGLVGTNAVAAIDVDTNEVVRTYTSSANPAARAHGPYLRDDTIYVAHETGDEVTGIDRETGVIELSKGGILQPTEVLPDRRERRLYVAARGEGKIRVIDLETEEFVGEGVAVGVQPETMLLTRDRRTLIVSMRGTPARLAFVDTRSLTLITTIDLAGTGTNGDLAAMSRDGRYVYATFDRGAAGFGGVAVVDVERRTLVDTWDYPEVGRLHGVAFTPHRPRR